MPIIRKGRLCRLYYPVRSRSFCGDSRAQVKPHEGVVLMTRAWLFTLASYLVVAAGVTAKGDEPPVPDRANEQGAGQPAAASTFGSIRRTGIAQQVEPGSQSGPGTRAGQTSKTGSPAASAPMPAARQKDTTALPTERRVTIPPPRPYSATAANRPGTSSSDAKIRRAQAQPGGTDMTAIPLSNTGASTIPPPRQLLNDTMVGGHPIAMQAALYGAITSNPDLVTLREGNALGASAEAVEVARHFPTTLNPTLWLDYRPITMVPNGTFGTGPHQGSASGNNFYHYGQDYIYVSLRQPVELGHQTTHRYHIAQAAYDQQKWIVVQAELTALVQTYRFFQTAAYRREKFRLAQQLADFNDRLQETLERRMEANQVQAADVALGRVESRATRQLVTAARQDYLTATHRPAQPDRHSRRSRGFRAPG